MSPRPFLGILFAIVVSVAPPSRVVEAASITVTTTTDELNTDGDCSLREAVQAANTNAAVDACTAGQSNQTDTITLPAGTYTLTQAGFDDSNVGGDLDILDNAAADDLAIVGAGAATTIIQACTVDQLAAECPAGQGVFDRVLNVIDARVAMSGVTIRHGRANFFVTGGGIWVRSINTAGAAGLTLTDAVITKNGGANVVGAGLAAEDSTTTLTRVTVTDNVGGAGGNGAVYSGSAFFGLGATLVMTDCTVSGNTGSVGGVVNGLPNGGTITATLTGCTISGNAGIGFRNGTTATITNSTISGNVSNSLGAGISTGGTLNLRSSTVTLNHRINGPSADGAGGIYGGGSIIFRNTIVAGNLSDTVGRKDPDCDASGIVSEGFNIVGDGFGCPLLVDGMNGDRIGTAGAVLDAKLGPLADNGGLTLTHALLDGSLAIDGGNPATPGSGGTACPATDQRGETRPSGAACDVGSVEGGSGGGGAITATAVKPATGGTAGTVQVKVFGSGFVAGAVVRLVRAGFADVVGSATNVREDVVTTSFDLHDAAPGVWTVEVKNPDDAVATLTDAFTVEAGGQSDLFAEVLTPIGFQVGRVQSIHVMVGNRGTVDAYGVPLSVALGEQLQWFIPFEVSPPPAQPGQIATDWFNFAIENSRPPSPVLPEQGDSFYFLLPIVPAGSSNLFRIRVQSPVSPELEVPGDAPATYVAANVGNPYFQPDLSAEVVAFYVEQAKDYAVRVHGTTVFPDDAAIEAYVRTQLAAVVADGRLAAAGTPSGSLPIYSQALLIIDTGQFIAGETVTASATSDERGWLARIVAQLVGGSAEARYTGPHPCDLSHITNPTDRRFCEQEIDPCRRGCESDDEAPKAPPPPSPFDCDGTVAKILGFLGAPCKPPPRPAPDPQPSPTPRKVPFRNAHDPNYKAGPGEPGGFVDGVTPLSYAVTFENIATATGDAFEVTVTDQLDVAKYDLDTFNLGPITFSDYSVPVPPGLKSFSTEVDLRPGVNILVGIDSDLDVATGIVTWKFTTLDPATHQFPEDPADGFLPPNVTSPEGEGEMLFTVSAKPGLGLGTTICNDASIVFDFNPAIVTNEFCNTIGSPENCENCIDDDGDGKIDRADPDCAAPANGAGAGVGDAATGKAVDKCAKAIRKVGAKLTSNRLKQLGACEKAVADCVQLKPGDAACLTKAKGTCTKARTALPTAETKLTAAIVKACGEPAVTAANLNTAAGVGFDGEASACAGRGVATLATVTDVAECVRRRHQCAAERVLAAAVPRASELLGLGGFDLDTDFRCLATGANGGGSAIAAEKRKALRKCDAAIQKAASKLVAGRTKAEEACGAAVFTCVQTKPGDSTCVAKAGGTCTKAVAGLPKLATDFSASIAKACGASPLVADDLLTSEGLGASAFGAHCAKLGIASLATVADVTACFQAQLTCHVDHVLEATTPRLGELLDLGGVTLP